MWCLGATRGDRWGEGLLTSEVVTSDLGTHGGLRLRGRVRRQTVRLALGSRVRASAVWLRPVGVEVRAADADVVTAMRFVPIAPPTDPLVQVAQGVIAIWVVSMVIRGVATMLRARRKAA